MRRITISILSAIWTGLFSAAALFALFAAEEGGAAAASSFMVADWIGALPALDNRPLMAGCCLGAALVASLNAAVALSALLEEHASRQTVLISEMAFGGGLGMLILAFFATFPEPGHAAPMAIFATAAILVASFLVVRSWAVTPPETAEPRRAPARDMARAAASQLNVVRFPVEQRIQGRR